MLNITIPGTELWDENKLEFVYLKETRLQFEHSLVSLFKWEAKWERPFLSRGQKTDAEIMDYIRCMTLTQNVKPEVYRCLTNENMDCINRYIEAPMTATTFSETGIDGKGKGRGGEVVTAELIYYWMIALNIPMECQKWHLNRLLTLIRICNVKNQPPKRVSKRSIMSRNARLNAERRQKLKTKG